MHQIDPALIWGMFAWLIAVTASGAFFMGMLWEKVKSHSRRLNENDTEMAEVHKEQQQIATAFASMKATLDETRRYSAAIWRRMNNVEQVR